MKFSRQVLGVVFIFFLVTGASCPENIQPQTAKESLIVVEYSYQAVLKEIQQLVLIGTLKGDNARKTLEALTKTKDLLKFYRLAVLSDEPSEDLLTNFNTALAITIREMRGES